ncbi:hypothetical protein QSH14_16770 [Proteus faecis]|uniref:Uncharacterized protein n=1 Tax=Proteus faecis TaxID=2050967 RepID=A0AAW7CWB4_9GAMM|nr:hypothetical protein [Proteus faecis]MDL5168704.1 hypothetical protein [Proteus faecis]MDL5276688.1 hypothetical protein [Proteus faecis]MDL5280255.1 hypothetical protein [Proteus faecis]MDL5309284.1 hypothetical protein [Proteus faecis]MDL5316398.1 hypothetical protein [Proteus faecis]
MSSFHLTKVTHARHSAAQCIAPKMPLSKAAQWKRVIPGIQRLQKAGRIRQNTSEEADTRYRVLCLFVDIRVTG